ncbi:MAG: endonuclease III domain-containing protein [bacterium]
MADPTAAALKRIFDRLLAAYGHQHWWPADSPFEVCVGAVLTQNTAWPNVERAIANLKAAGRLDPARLLALTEPALARLIRPAGCPNVKVRRLLALVRWLHDQGGLDALRHRPTAPVRAGLLGVHGVGAETADSILLYALGRPSFVVDAYTRRILSRYGLARGDEPYDRLKAMFERALPPDARRFNEFHALLVRLARTHCRARALCPGCPLEAD